MKISNRILMAVSLLICFSFGVWFLGIKGIEIPVLSSSVGRAFALVVVTPIANTYAWIDSYIYWRQFTCDKLVSVDEIVRLMTEHKDVVQKIAQLRHDTVISVPKNLMNSVYKTTPENMLYDISMTIIVCESRKCPGKGYIKIKVRGESARAKIKEIMNGKSFFGVPCHLVRD